MFVVHRRPWGSLFNSDYSWHLHIGLKSLVLIFGGGFEDASGRVGISGRRWTEGVIQGWKPGGREASHACTPEGFGGLLCPHCTTCSTYSLFPIACPHQMVTVHWQQPCGDEGASSRRCQHQLDEQNARDVQAMQEISGLCKLFSYIYIFTYE